jgi:hypothetical protein
MQNVYIIRKVAKEKVITLYFTVRLQQTYIGIENILVSSLHIISYRPTLNLNTVKITVLWRHLFAQKDKKWVEW